MGHAMLEGGLQLERTIDRMLMYASISRGKRLGEAVAEPWPTLLDKLRQTLAETPEVTELAFEAIAPEAPATLTWHPVEVRRALAELAHNAGRFSRDGAVEVRVELSIREGQSCLVVTVTDHGPGMSSTAIEHALEAYVQGDMRLSREHDGLGLGLPLARAAVESVGGTLHLMSPAGGGLVATCAVPMEVEALPEPAAVVPGSARWPVLIAEDDQSGARLLEVLLSRAGYACLHAPDGAEALARIREQPLQAVVLDVGMPRVNGLEVARIVREELDFLDLPLIGITAHELPTIAADVRRRHLDALLSKPVSRAELLVTLERLVSSSV